MATMSSCHVTVTWHDVRGCCCYTQRWWPVCLPWCVITIAVSSLVLPLPISCLPLACPHSFALSSSHSRSLPSALVCLGLDRARVCSRSRWLALAVVSVRFLPVVFAFRRSHLLWCLWRVCVLVTPTHSHYLHLFMLVDTVTLWPLPATHIISISKLTYIALMWLTRLLEPKESKN